MKRPGRGSRTAGGVTHIGRRGAAAGVDGPMAHHGGRQTWTLAFQCGCVGVGARGCCDATTKDNRHCLTHKSGTQHTQYAARDIPQDPNWASSHFIVTAGVGPKDRLTSNTHKAIHSTADVPTTEPCSNQSFKTHYKHAKLAITCPHIALCKGTKFCNMH